MKQVLLFVYAAHSSVGPYVGWMFAFDKADFLDSFRFDHVDKILITAKQTDEFPDWA